MKVAQNFILVLFLGLVSAVVLVANVAGPTAANNNPTLPNSPSTITTCTSCHAGSGPNTGGVTMTGPGFPSPWIPNQEYNLTVTVPGAVRHGFQVSALMGNGPYASAGTITATDPTNTAVGTVNGIVYVEHTGTGANRTLASGGNVFTFKWTAPAAGAGTVRFDVAGLAGNGSGSSGDQTYLQTYFVSEFIPDTTPNPFSFTPQTNAGLSTLATSNTITPTGYDTATTISVSGGSYSINGGSFVTTAGTISPGQNVAVRQTSSGSFNTTTITTLTIGGVNGTFSVTTVPQDTTPDPFSFTSQTGIALNTVVTSNTITPAGYNSAAAISVSGGSYSINGGAFVTTAGTITPGQTVAVRQTSSGSFSTTTTATLTIGGVAGNFGVTTQASDPAPDPFSFTAQTGIALSTVVTSNTITPVGYNTSAAISVSGGSYSINGGAFVTTAGTITPGQTVAVRQTSSASFSTTTTTTLTIGGVAGNFAVTTQPLDTVPDPFSFASQLGVARSAAITSNTITPTGYNSSAAISVSGGSYSINGGSFVTTSGTITPGQNVAVRQTSSSGFTTTTTATLTIGGVAGAFSITTQGVDTTPDPFSFTSQTNAALSTLVTSNTITPVGYDTAAAISVSGGSYSINGGTFVTTTGTIGPGQTVAVRQTSSSAFNTTTTVTLTIGGVSGPFSVTTQALDTTPDAFSFTSQSGSALNTVVTSNTITPTGYNSPASIGVSGGSYSINGGAFVTTSGTLSPGQTVAVRQTSSTSFSTKTTVTLTIGGVAGFFDVTTLPVPTNTLSVSKSGTGSGTVTSNPAGINCGVTCSAPIVSPQVATLIATAAPGSVFGGWNGDADCTDGSLTMSAARNCVARFDLPQSNATVLRGDFDGDGKTDIAVYRPPTGEWFLRLSTQGYVIAAGNWYFQWGVPGDVPLAGDFDGDGKTDIAVYRPSSGEWFLRLSTQNYAITAGNWYFQWGVAADVPVAGDFDGDGKTDITVYRPSTGEWFLRLSTQGYAVAVGNWYFQWGVPDDQPLSGDFDGDGKTDIAVYRPLTGEWFLRLSTQNYAIGAGNWTFQWGVAGDQPVATDFDGDRKADIAVYRPSTGEWYIRLSTQNYAIGVGNWFFQWGVPGDLTQRGDFDGDGKTDIAVYRPATGEWFIRLSTQGYVIGVGNWFFQWGVPGDLSLRR